MSRKYHTYVVIFAGQDWYIILNGMCEVRARTDSEAIRKARHKLKLPEHSKVWEVFGPYKKVKR